MAQSSLINVGDELRGTDERNSEHINLSHKSPFSFWIDRCSRNVTMGEYLQSNIAVDGALFLDLVHMAMRSGRRWDLDLRLGEFLLSSRHCVR